MRSIVVSVLALAFCVTAGGAFFDGRALAGSDENKAKDNKSDNKDKKRKPKFTIGKETTYVTRPLDEDGYIDYAAALNDRLRKGVTPGNNANVLIWKAVGPRPEGKEMSAEFYKWLGIDPPPAKGDYFIRIDRYLTDHLKIEPGPQWEEISGQMDRAGQRPWTAKQYPRVADWLKANEKPLAVAIEASKRPRYFLPLLPNRSKKGSSGLIGALLPSVQACRGMGHALTARAMLHVGEGRFDDAWQDLLACHRLGRIVARGATLIEFLVGIAIDTIAGSADLAYLERAPLEAKDIKDRLRDLQRLPPMPSAADKVALGERFSCLDTILLLARGGLEDLAGDLLKDAKPQMERFLSAIDWDPILRFANRHFNRIAAAMRLEDRAEREKQLERITKELDELIKKSRPSGTLGKLLLPFTMTPQKMGEQIGQIWIGLLMPAIYKVQQASDRSEQIQRNLHVAFALACYRHEHGRYPDKLDALTPAYLKDVPQDIFSGEALIYRPKEKGYLLYSVGVNERDDEGRGYGDDPPADDLNVRIPLPELRRK